ncbi:hypothetical protein LX36DRAFT_97877 [Colletotrichum falcatum]|nr:hypothetical protein LX36DRAFT_97877 [Colletotrichum falcatum]
MQRIFPHGPAGASAWRAPLHFRGPAHWRRALFFFLNLFKGYPRVETLDTLHIALESRIHFHVPLPQTIHDTRDSPPNENSSAPCHPHDGLDRLSQRTACTDRRRNLPGRWHLSLQVAREREREGGRKGEREGQRKDEMNRRTGSVAWQRRHGAGSESYGV